MQALKELWSTDPDILFSYNTNKIVSIRDRRLGLLYYCGLGGIVLYIVFYNLLVEKKYLAMDTPAGSFRLSLQRSPNPLPLEDLPYCLQTNEEYNGFPNLECKYYEQENVVSPRTEESAMLATTRLTIHEMFANCDFSSPNCTYDDVIEPQSYYVADIEHFTLLIDHSIYATDLELQASATSLKGKLLDVNGDEMTLTPPNQVGIGTYDILELQLLLNASNTISLDYSDDGDESFRYAGIILLVLFDYTNTISFDTSYFEYTLSIRRVEETEFKSEEIIYHTFPNDITFLNRHGIRMIFLRKGTVGKFDFQTLLINVIAGSALLSVVTIGVDTLAKYFMPGKDIYREYMIQPTPDFSDIRDELEKKQRDSKVKPEEEEHLLQKSVQT